MLPPPEMLRRSLWQVHDLLQSCRARIVTFMKEMKVKTWEELAGKIDELRTTLGTDASLVFRGQANSCWPLSTTLERNPGRMLFKDYYRIISRIKPQIESLTAHRWKIPEYPEVERLCTGYQDFDRALWSGRCPGYDYMVHLRHHGFPSPLLDWTRSLYVAAFFAFSTAKEADSDVSIYSLSHHPNRISGNQLATVYRYGPYVKTHRRHFLQQSEYTLCLFYEEGDWWFDHYDSVFDKGLHQQGECQKFTIPYRERQQVLGLLDEHNLNAFSLFGSEESMMETLAAREFRRPLAE
jgi:hypothetical protein